MPGIRFGPSRVEINWTRTRSYVLNRAESEHVTPLAREVRTEARTLAQKRTGTMRNLIRTWNTSKTGWTVTHRVGTPMPYAIFPHSGTKAHDIYPRNANGRLVFYWKRVGRVVSLKHVNHPGSKGSFFLTKPLLTRGTARGFRVLIR